MNMKITYIALTLYALCYAMLFGTWAGIVFGKVPDAGQIVTYIIGALGALTGHILTMLNPGRAGGSVAPTVDESAPSSAQAGFARIGMLVMLAVLGAAMLGGCATGAAPRPTPQQLATQVCPAALLTMASLTALEDLPAAARADLAKASPVVGAVCAPGAAVDLSSLQALASTVTPALLRVADAAGLSPTDQKHIADDLEAVQLVLNLALISAGKAPVLLSPSAPAPLVPPQPSDASVLQ